ncbi:DUF1800 family protein [Candidatus Uabimicrobium sp. HlEnr_7]|uniref:DUF1800 family protein n=1 Tax=Candidatus Uabimicrobium helgolandensis TaxID=3095367 RepID=UPI003558E7C3
MKILLLFMSCVFICSEELSFLYSTTVVRENETRMIVISKKTATKKDTLVTVKSLAPEFVKIIEQPTLLAKHNLAYVRVRGIKLGSAKLVLENGSELIVECKAKDNHRAHLQIITPISGSSVYGKFVVAVDVSSYNNKAFDKIQLKSGNHQFEAYKILHLDAIHKRYLFSVNSELLPTTASLVAKAWHRYKIIGHSQVIVSTSKVLAKKGECEDDYIVNVKSRFNRNRNRKIRKVFHPDAGNKTCIFQASTFPVWSFEYNIAKQGNYQLILRAKGDFAGGAFPGVSVHVNNKQNPVTSGRIVDSNWHRTVIGKPFSLTKGKNIVSVLFVNDFFSTPWQDRNLMLDQYELISVEEQADTSMMMSQPTSREEIKIILRSLFDGEETTGCTFVDGTCITSSSIAPRVKLHVNDEVVYEQTTFDIFFPIFRECLQKGKNTVYLSAQIGNGPVFTSLKQELINPKELNRPLPKFYRFSGVDLRWDNQKKLTKDNQKKSDVLFFATNETRTLQLPKNIRGNFRIYVDARGKNFRGKAKLQVTVDKQELPVFEVPQFWNIKEIGQTKIDNGQIKVSFINDAFEEKIGDRNLFVNAIILVQVMPPDTTPPSVRVLYPEQNQIVYGGDVIIAQIYDDGLVGPANIYINGQTKNMNIQRLGRAGHYIFPLPLTHLKTGKHYFFVRVSDSAGNVSESKEIAFNVVSEKPQMGTKYSRAVALLNRFAYGPELDELGKVLVLGENTWLTQNITHQQSSKDSMIISRVVEQFPRQGSYAIQQRIILQLLLMQNTVRGRFVMWAQNHFSTWLRKVQGMEKWQEHEQFNKEGVCHFHDLLLTSATSPAMLFYLDQDSSFTNRINENYAREIMELHTLGVNGGYSQQDVTALSRLLTGWTSTITTRSDSGGGINREQRFVKMLNSSKQEKILGVHFPVATGNEKIHRILRVFELLAAHPNTAKFICQKLADQYVSSPAPTKLVEDLTKVFHESYGDFREILLFLSKHPLFWEDALLCKKFTTPQDYALRLGRCTNMQISGVISRYLGNSGMSFFDKATPDGYPQHAQFYTDSNMILQRWKLSNDLQNQFMKFVPGPWQRSYTISNREFLEETIDIIAMRITGHVLNEKSQKIARNILNKTHKDHRAKLKELIMLMTKLPEMNFK